MEVPWKGVGEILGQGVRKTTQRWRNIVENAQGSLSVAVSERVDAVKVDSPDGDGESGLLSKIQ